MNVAQYVIKRLADYGIDTCALLYGGAIADLVDAIPGRMNYVVMQHEQACSFFAEGYAKTKGIPGLAIGTSGPGGQNMMTGIANCFFDSVPCIFLAGQVATRFMTPKGSGLRQIGFQEWDVVSAVKPITKYARTVMSAEEIGWTMDQALHKATNGRPGPVLIDLPNDVQRQEVPSALTLWTPTLQPALTGAAQDFLRDLACAKRPGILVGGGAYAAREAIIKFANLMHIPCFRTWNAQDIVTDDQPCYAGTVGTYGGPGRNFGIQNCDLLLALGCRFSGRITGGQPETFARGSKKYIVNVDSNPTAGQVHGIEIQQSCEQFMEELKGWPEPTDFAWLAQCVVWKDKYDPVKPEMLTGTLHHYGFMRRLSEVLPNNAIVVSDTGGNVIQMGHCFLSKRGQRIFTSNGNTPMFFAMCAAIGAWFAEPTRPIICIIGDGGMSGNIQELQTIKHYNIPIKVFIINNGILGNTKSYQRVNKKAELACGPDGYSAPDFTLVAEAYGLETITVDLLEYLDQDIAKALAMEGAVIVDVPHYDFCTYEPRMSRWDAAINEMYPPLPEEEFLANCINPPLEGWEKRR